ncbi:YajG family lipoprotein [Campylobacter mucosalis]|uniref:YajG family lipoprotein n=1 Tax=Campylobacter mucosalis TaxID=202 RepID=UPI00147030C8|nr:YajG family lipoprotein [Campylobacter mucosalis]
MKFQNYKFIILAFFILLTGCATRQTFISLAPYSPTHQKQQHQGNFIIANVFDARKNKDIIATITGSNGEINEYVVLNSDVAMYFKQALEVELKSLGVIQNPTGAVINITITEFTANLSGYAKDNAKANMKVNLVAIKDGQNIMKNFADTQSKFQLIHTGGAFEPLLKSVIDDMVGRVARELLNI